MKVVFLLPGVQREASGGYKVVYDYATWLAGRGHDVTLLHAVVLPGATPDRSRVTARALRRVAATVVRTAVLRRPLVPWMDLRAPVRTRVRLVASHRDLAGHDVAVATSCHTAPAVAAAAARGDGPAGAYLIQHFEDWLADGAFVESTWRLPLRRLVVSGWLLRRAEAMGLTAEHVPNAIDADEFPAGPPTDQRPLSVLALVSPHPWKRTDLVAAAYRDLEQRHPGVRLTTFGVGPRPEGLPESAVHHQGPTRAELRALYQSSRVYLCASDSEGWGLPPAEAMSSGCAVVSTDLPSVREYADGVARFAPVGNGAALTGLVDDLLTDEADCRRRGLAGVARMRASGLDRSAAQLEAALRDAARRHRTGPSPVLTTGGTLAAVPTPALRGLNHPHDERPDL